MENWHLGYPHERLGTVHYLSEGGGGGRGDFRGDLKFWPLTRGGGVPGVIAEL